MTWDIEGRKTLRDAKHKLTRERHKCPASFIVFRLFMSYVFYCLASLHVLRLSMFLVFHVF
jgi:hypothetical protein